MALRVSCENSEHRGLSLVFADALDYVQKIEKKIVLVNGKQLAEFMIDYDIGVTAGKTYSIKKIDVDYFEES
jgi:restriction system protein